jgi:hypothetical protein
MCAGDDHHCPDFELHRRQLLEELDSERRSFLKSAFVTGGGAAAAWAAGGTVVSPASAQSTARPGGAAYHDLPATAETVH